MLGEPIWNNECAKWDEGNDSNREADGSDGLRDGDCTGDAKCLDADEEPDLPNGSRRSSPQPPKAGAVRVRLEGLPSLETS